MAEQKQITIPATDGFGLSALLLKNEGGISPKAVIQFHAGTVIRKEFYLKFCSFFADNCFDVILFDYRGVGESRPDSLVGFSASISDWGIKDAAGVGNWLIAHYPDTPKLLLAHSMGGQIIGLMPNWNIYDRMMVVASSSGNWNNFIPSYRRKVEWSSRLLFPIVLKIMGYAPGRLGLGQDWPKGVALEWYSNCKRNGLMAEYLSGKNNESYYDRIDKEIIAWFLSDDHMATPKTMPNYKKSYPNARVESYMIRPESCGLESIGHFGLFKEKTRDTLWNEILHWLENCDASD